MRLYHATTDEAAAAIVLAGFRDSTGFYGIVRDMPLTGVWLSDQPLTANEGAGGEAVLIIDLPLAEDDLVAYEVVEEGRSFREFLIPAAIINERGNVSGPVDLWIILEEMES